MIKIINGGMQTSIQGLGRHGFQKFGVPVSGAMDWLSLALANLLVGNEHTETALEFAFVGCTIRFEQRAFFAICGGDFELLFDGEPIEMNHAYCAKNGNILEIGAARQGCRGYCAIGGGFDIADVLGGCDTYIKGGFGGHDGRALRQGDALRLRAPQSFLLNMPQRKIQRERLPLRKSLRVILGPQDDLFSVHGIHTFLSRQYTILPESDRMGYRTRGMNIEYAANSDGNIISDGVAMGSIQVASGQPLIMMADRQTTGGYAKIATIISADLPLAAQCKPDDTVFFEQVSIESAQALRQKQLRLLQDLECEINRL